MRPLLLALALALNVGDLHADEAAPDTSRIMHLIGRYGLAQACPIAPDTALTNGHVVDPRPFDRTAPMTPYLWSLDSGQGGAVLPRYALGERDLAVLDGAGLDPYPVAQDAPAVGQRVWFVGYRYDGRSTLKTEVIRATVLRVVAGHVIYMPGGRPGSSGSCVLNAAGEVVAINAGMFHDSEAGIGVGVWRGVFEVRK